jgi:methylmalonyl-CoA/ethylmalonyl-CoA epimerase
MVKVKKFNHIAIGVEDIEAGLPFWRDALGLKLEAIEEVPSQKARVAFLPVGESEVELVQPTDPGTGMARFIQERGGGMHHLCLEVEDIDQALTELKARGVRLIDETAQVLPGRKMAFIHPKATGGVLVELYELTK